MYTCSVVLTAFVIEWMEIIGDAPAASSATSRVSLRWIFIKKSRARHSTVISFSIAALSTVSTNRTFSTKRLRILNNVYRNPAIPNIPLVGTQMWSKSECIVEDEYRWSETSPWATRWSGMNIEAGYHFEEMDRWRCSNGISLREVR